MSALDTEAREAALEAVREVSDTPLTYWRVRKGDYDTSTGTQKERIEDMAIYAIRDGFSTSTLGMQFAPGSLIHGGDIKVTAPAIQFPIWEPSAGDRIVIAGVTHTVKAVRTVYGGDSPVLYELQVRR